MLPAYLDSTVLLVVAWPGRSAGGLWHRCPLCACCCCTPRRTILPTPVPPLPCCKLLIKQVSRFPIVHQPPPADGVCAEHAILLCPPTRGPQVRRRRSGRRPAADCSRRAAGTQQQHTCNRRLAVSVLLTRLQQPCCGHACSRHRQTAAGMRQRRAAPWCSSTSFHLPAPPTR